MAMRLFDIFTRAAFFVASIMLILLAASLIFYGGTEIYRVSLNPDETIGPALLDAVGYTVIAIAVFDVGKYLFEEEVIKARELRHAREARHSLTKFLSTIAIAVFLEAIVAVFEANKEDVRTMIYPTILLFTGVTLIVGLGIYQRLSSLVEKEVGEVGESGDDDGRATPLKSG
ncbi:GNAT family acetyltransferase [Pararhizobium haloflavum]|uniref:GNAT family acetyltransferase n=1 Tax=Pararhizobium haloflavum TaxID=2037914 RepID=UPI000C1A49F5|nr:GNAT family acetyltransferase [Pararhizobium haloflavum]